MTAKNRIILSIIAIVTTLAVAGSMIFIIFAATRGQVNAGVTIGYQTGYQIRGKITTRYTTTPLTGGFGNGEGDKIIKTTDGADFVEFKGWQDEEDTTKNLQTVNIELTIENPWVIFEIRLEEETGIVCGTLSLVEATYENVEVLVYGHTNGDELTEINPDALAEYEWVDYTSQGAGVDLTTTSSYRQAFAPTLYYMIRVKDTTKGASFSGGINCFLFREA